MDDFFDQAGDSNFRIRSQKKKNKKKKNLGAALVQR